MLKELDTIRTIAQVNDLVPEGTMGVIHQCYSGKVNMYLIEFLDNSHSTICITEAAENQIEIVENAAS